MERAQGGVPGGLVALTVIGIACWGWPSGLRAATLTFPGEEPITVSADELEHLPKGLYRGEGSVVVTRGAMRLTSDRRSEERRVGKECRL